VATIDFINELDNAALYLANLNFRNTCLNDSAKGMEEAGSDLPKVSIIFDYRTVFAKTSYQSIYQCTLSVEADFLFASTHINTFIDGRMPPLRSFSENILLNITMDRKNKNRPR